MNRILIFGLPRTGTTLLENHLSKNFQIPGFSEPYSDCVVRSQWIDWTLKLEQGIVKVLTSNCIYEQWPINMPQLIGLNVFDSLVITHRNDRVDICLSLYYAERVVNKYQWKTHEEIPYHQFVCDQKFVESFCKDLKIFDQTIKWFNAVGVKYECFDYDKFLNNQDQYIFGSLINNQMQFKFKKSNIDYQSLCKNYQEVKQLISSHA